MTHKESESESEPGFKLCRSDIISIIGVLVIVAGIVASNAVMGEKINSCVEWQKQNQKLPSCVEANSNWIRMNSNLPGLSMKNELKLVYVGEEMSKLSEKIDQLNKTLLWFKNDMQRQSSKN